MGYCPSFKTLGIGALVYTDVKLGTFCFPDSTGAVAYLRLRIFTVRFNAGSAFQVPRPKVPRLVAKGTCNDAEGICEDLSIFRPYWPN